jgi:hypothetical protein
MLIEMLTVLFCEIDTSRWMFLQMHCVTNYHNTVLDNYSRVDNACVSML